MINLHERMLPTSAGVEPATSWSPVGRRIQLSHRGGHVQDDLNLPILRKFDGTFSLDAAQIKPHQAKRCFWAYTKGSDFPVYDKTRY